MLKTREIFEKIELDNKEQYKEMLEQVNIPDFYKCIAQYTGLNINEIADEAMIEYLTLWCKNKYKFFKMLGNNIKLDQDFKYIRPLEDLSNVFDDLGKEYPAYALWLREFRRIEKNKIEERRLSYNIKDILTELFPQFNIEGSTLTHFFKSKLNAEDDLVTKIGRIFENNEIEAKHTISIDPVDMMLASENPYNWQSCYRLELGREDSHADGCMAAVLDASSLITYVWEKEGEYNMYDNFKFKKIRYYRMRQWIAISEDFSAIHFNSIYPGKSDYDEEFTKHMRDMAETVAAKYMGVKNVWRKNDEIQVKFDYGMYVQTLWHCERTNYYGYGEYDSYSIYINSELTGEKIVGPIEASDFKCKNLPVYDERIVCACGCGSYVMGSDDCCEDDDEGYRFNGEGFIAENFYENEPDYKWCPYQDCECTCHCEEYDDCWEECEIYQQNNPVCSLDECTICEDPDFSEVRHGQMPACEGHCKNCWMWDDHHPVEGDDE